MNGGRGTIPARRTGTESKPPGFEEYAEPPVVKLSRRLQEVFADATGHCGVGVLLESVLADNLAFLERDRRLVRHIIEGLVAERVSLQ
jgi:hypothetical protein